MYAVLEALEHHARTIAAALDAASPLARVEFAGNPDVTDAFARFVDRWDEHRGGLRDGVSAAADALRAVRESFELAESGLIAALGEG